MKHLVVISILFSFSLMAYESKLPKCPKKFDNTWEACKGTYVASDKGKYIGEFYNAMMNGYGRYEKEGNVYEGYFKNWKFDGEGTYTYASGALYKGEFLRGYIHGKGKMIFDDKESFYEGDWVLAQKHGHGKYVWANGSVYEGDYKFDNMDGTGKYVWPDGSVYEGDYKFDNMDGTGKYVWPDGS